MNYHELRLRGLPESVIGHQAREFFAVYGNGVLPDTLFHYRDGKPIPDSESPIRFLGKPGKSGTEGHDIVIVGVGDRGADLLYTHARKLAEVVLTRFPSWLPRFDFKQGEWGAEGTKYPIRHRVGSMIIKAKSKEQSLDPAFVKIRLLDALNREIKNLELPGTITDDQISDLRVSRSVGVRVKSTLFMPAVSLDFTMPYRLTGPWQIGRLKARGYGRLGGLRSEKGGDHVRD